MIKKLTDLNQKIQKLLQSLANGLNGTGIYSAQFKGSRGINGFIEDLKGSKIEYIEGESLPTVSLEQVEETYPLINPVTGLSETVTTRTLKPSLVHPDRNTKEPKYVSFSELNNLKYCGGIVLYAAGSDYELWNKFVSDYSTLETFGKSFISNLSGGDDTIVSKLKPYVYSIEVQDEDNQYVSLNERDIVASKTTKIKVNFTNNSDELTQDEILKLSEVQGRDVDVSPKIKQSSLIITGTVDSTNISVPGIDDSVILYLGDNIDDSTKRIPFFVNPGIAETTINGKQIYSVIFTPVNSLKSTSDARYNVKVNKNVMSNENIRMDDEYKTQYPFLVSQTTIDSVEFI